MEIVDNFGQPIYNDPQPVRYAGFWVRFGASFLDGLIIGIPLTIVNWMLGSGRHQAGISENISP